MERAKSLAGPEPQQPRNFRFAPLNHFVAHWRRAGLHYRDFAVFTTLWQKAGFRTNVVSGITEKQLASDMGMSVTALKESVANLERAGCLVRRRGGRGHATQYTVTAPVERQAMARTA